MSDEEERLDHELISVRPPIQVLYSSTPQSVDDVKSAGVKFLFDLDFDQFSSRILIHCSLL